MSRNLSRDLSRKFKREFGCRNLSTNLIMKFCAGIYVNISVKIECGNFSRNPSKTLSTEKFKRTLQ